MTIQEKKSFLAVILEQIQKYEDDIENRDEHRAVIGDCPICENYILDPVGCNPKESCLKLSES